MLFLIVESILTLLNDQRLGASLQEAMSDEEAEEVRLFYFGLFVSCHS